MYGLPSKAMHHLFFSPNSRRQEIFDDAGTCPKTLFFFMKCILKKHAYVSLPLCSLPFRN